MKTKTNLLKLLALLRACDKGSYTQVLKGNGWDWNLFYEKVDILCEDNGISWHPRVQSMNQLYEFLEDLNLL